MENVLLASVSVTTGKYQMGDAILDRWTDGQMDRWIDVQYALVQGPVGSHLPTLLPSHPYVPTTPGWVTMGDGLTLFMLS